MDKLLLLCIIVIVGFIGYKIFLEKDTVAPEETTEDHVNRSLYLKYMHMAHPSKCFDCEKEMDYPYKYLGHSTKSFSAENEIIKKFGPEYAFYAQPNKCFSCEKQMNF